MTARHGEPQEFLSRDPLGGDECDWHRRHEPAGVRKCDRTPVVIRDGYGGAPMVRFCAEHDPVLAAVGLERVPTDVLRRELQRRQDSGGAA